MLKSIIDEGRGWDVWSPELDGEDMREYEAKDYAMELIGRGNKMVAVSETTYEIDEYDHCVFTRNFYAYDEETDAWNLSYTEELPW